MTIDHSVYLLWRNVYLGLMPISCLWCLFCCCWAEFFVYFGNQAIVSFVVCKYFLPFCRLSFHVGYGLLCCAKAWLGPICLFLLLFLLPWKTDQRKHWYNLCQRMFCLCSLLGLVWGHVFYLSLQAILSLLLCMACSNHTHTQSHWFTCNLLFFKDFFFF